MQENLFEYFIKIEGHSGFPGNFLIALIDKKDSDRQ